MPPAKETAIEVVVRIRPCKKGYDPAESTVRVENSGSSKRPTSLTVWNWRNSEECTAYSFHAVYDGKTQQATLHKRHVSRLVPQLLSGMNASVLAYGPTGCGKTWTMQGSAEKPGIIPRVVGELFQHVKDMRDKAVKYTVSTSYLEIYNERVYDLLSFSGKDLALRENRNREIFVPDLSQVEITSSDDFDVQYKKGCNNRRTGATKLNSTSSRSHAVVIVRVESHDSEGVTRVGKLNLVDLAGSEDNRRTANEGLRLKESGCINKSLFVLGQVVDALTSAGAGRIPYRDSKLTRLLSDSLGGNSVAIMVTCVAPEKEFYQDVTTALNFATKSKTIQNRPFVNEVVVKPKPKPKVVNKGLSDATNATTPNNDLGGGGKKAKTTAANVGLEDLLSLDEPHPLVKESTEKIMKILNTGDVAELMKLNGIGAKRAECIYKFRQERQGAPFVRMSDLIEVTGISTGFARSLLRTNLEQGYITSQLK